jgi:hypothetical protein
MRPYCESTIFTVVRWRAIRRDGAAGPVDDAAADDEGVRAAGELVELEAGVETEV